MTEQDPWEAAQTYAWEQDMTRGDWPTPRTAKMPEPPWPDPDNPMLAALLHDAFRHIASGAAAEEAILQLATHCWFEGGIDGYDRGQRDGRAAIGG